MGRLIYNHSTSIDLDDRVIAHLEAVIGTKLRRGEAFLFTWPIDVRLGSGRTTVWINPASALAFSYRRHREPLNRAWIEELAASANSPGGLEIVPEPGRSDVDTA